MVAVSIGYISVFLGLLFNVSYGLFIASVFFGWKHLGEILSFLIQIFVFGIIIFTLSELSQSNELVNLPFKINECFFKIKCPEDKVKGPIKNFFGAVYDFFKKVDKPEVKETKVVDDPKIPKARISRESFYLILVLVFGLILPYIIMYLWKWLMHK